MAWAGQQCEGGIPTILQTMIDQQCGNFLGEEASESTYSSGESGDDTATYEESCKSEPESVGRSREPRVIERLEASRRGEKGHSSSNERLIDKEIVKELERTRERERTEKGGLQTEDTKWTNDIERNGQDRVAEREKAKEASRHQIGQPPTMDEERSLERVKRRQQEGPMIRNKNFIREFITQLSTSGLKLLQHRRSHRQAFSKPTEVTAFLRLGADAGAAGFCEPCLQFLAHDGIPLVSVDLFDVRSLEKPTALQLQSYPLAVPGNCIYIRTNPGDFVFEATREDDALRIVHGMRWLIARLSFNLIIGNVNVSCELLDVGKKAFKQRVGESNRAGAMNDLTNHLVDKSSLFPS
jgi:hypothetical protein